MLVIYDKKTHSAIEGSRDVHDLTNALVRRLGPSDEWRYANAAFAEFYAAAKSVTIGDGLDLPMLATKARDLLAAMTAADEAASNSPRR